MYSRLYVFCLPWRSRDSRREPRLAHKSVYTEVTEKNASYRENKICAYAQFVRHSSEILRDAKLVECKLRRASRIIYYLFYYSVLPPPPPRAANNSELAYDNDCRMSFDSLFKMSRETGRARRVLTSCSRSSLIASERRSFSLLLPRPFRPPPPSGPSSMLSYAITLTRFAFAFCFCFLF